MRSQWFAFSLISLRISIGSALALTRHCWKSVLNLAGPSPSHDLALTLLLSSMGLIALRIIFACLCFGGFCRSYMVRNNVLHFVK